jgi:hypothetical protein
MSDRVHVRDGRRSDAPVVAPYRTQQAVEAASAGIYPAAPMQESA